MFSIYTIKFSDRVLFERALRVYFDNAVSIRSNSAGGLDIGYADMILTFSDVSMAFAAKKRFEKENITDFLIDF